MLDLLLTPISETHTDIIASRCCHQIAGISTFILPVVPGTNNIRIIV